MNDSEVDAYITERIGKKAICLQDMIGPKYIDPDPENKQQHWKERARWNRFKFLSGEMRMCELLTEDEFDPERPYNNLGIPIKDIVRYWWNGIADQACIMDEIFEEIYTEYKDRMLPERQEERHADLTVSFDDLLEAE